MMVDEIKTDGETIRVAINICFLTQAALKSAYGYAKMRFLS